MAPIRIDKGFSKTALKKHGWQTTGLPQDQPNTRSAVFGKMRGRIVWLSVASGVGVVAAVAAATCMFRGGNERAASARAGSGAPPVAVVSGTLPATAGGASGAGASVSTSVTPAAAGPSAGRTTPVCQTYRWSFDEPSGDTVQDGVSDIDGSLGGGVYSCTPSRVPGRVNGALAFDGVNDYVGFGTSLAHLNGALTVSAWVKPVTPPTGVGRVVANTFNSVARRGWLLGCQYGSADRFEFQFFSPTGKLETVFCKDFFRDWSNRWVHVAGVFKPAVSGNDGYLALYTNGVLAARNATPYRAIGTTNMNLRIGMRAGGINQGMWSGLFDEVGIVGAALSPEEIRAQLVGH